MRCDAREWCGPASAAEELFRSRISSSTGKRKATGSVTGHESHQAFRDENVGTPSSLPRDPLGKRRVYPPPRLHRDALPAVAGALFPSLDLGVVGTTRAR